MRHKSLIILSCAALMFALSTIPAEAQRHHGAAGMSPSFRIRRFCGASGSTAASTSLLSRLRSMVSISGIGVSARRLPERPCCRVRLQVTPRDASVFVDGYAAGVVDDYDGVFQRLRLVPGPHEIVIYHPGHRTLRQNVYYNPGSTHTIRHTLESARPRRNAGATAGAARAAGDARNAGAVSRERSCERSPRHARAARAAGRCDGARRRRAVARTAVAGPARDSARRRPASRARREARISNRSRSTSTCARARRPASTSVCWRSERS